MQPDRDPSAPSPRQLDVLELFRSRAADRLPPPTYREIGDALGIASTNGVADHVKALIRKGHLRRAGRGGASRCVQLTGRGRRALVDLLAGDVREALLVLRGEDAARGLNAMGPRELGLELLEAAVEVAGALCLARQARRAAQLADDPVLAIL